MDIGVQWDESGPGVSAELIDRVMSLVRQTAGETDDGILRHEVEEFLRWIVADPEHRLGDALLVLIQGFGGAVNAASMSFAAALPGGPEGEERDNFRAQLLAAVEKVLRSEL